jgi:hypothetical protein
MSKLTKQQEEQLDEIADMLDDTLADDDYCIIVGPDGELKSIMLPDDVPFELPENVTKMLAVFGITDADNIAGNATIH